MLFFFDAPATAEIYTLSLHDALPISGDQLRVLAAEIDDEHGPLPGCFLRYREGENLSADSWAPPRSEEHTSELQSRRDLVCRLLLEKKKIEFSSAGRV